MRRFVVTILERLTFPVSYFSMWCRALYTRLQPESAEVYQFLRMSRAKNIILNILSDPHNFQNHIATYAAATIMKVTYGKTVPTLLRGTNIGFA
ncbi:hypothetical protein BDR07DRAFT_551180 [Suillus spraguei]|nr:hypothetical protein BDR07DRAFT_551180 [Suillus spraguei]